MSRMADWPHVNPPPTNGIYTPGGYKGSGKPQTWRCQTCKKLVWASETHTHKRNVRKKPVQRTRSRRRSVPTIANDRSTPSIKCGHCGGTYTSVAEVRSHFAR